MMLDRVFGSTSATDSGMGSISVPLKEGAYFRTLSFSYYFLMDQETGVIGPTGVLCPGGMELAGSEGSLFT